MRLAAWRVADPLEYHGKDLIQEELALVRQALEAAGVDHTETFYPQLSPGWLGHFLFNEHYPSAEEYWYALAEAWRSEYEAVAEAGFILQLDDPALADKYYMFNPHTTAIPLEHIVDLLLKVRAQAYLIQAGNVRLEADYRVWQDVKQALASQRLWG